MDVTPPAGVTTLAAAVKTRRQTSFNLTWTAPDDGGKAATSYEVRVSKSVIDTQAKFDAARNRSSIPALQRPPVRRLRFVADRRIETDYYFAVEATDIGGNRGPLASTSAAARALFSTVERTPDTTDQLFGAAIDGASDLNGDGYSDILIGHGAGQDARIYFGGASGVSTTPSVIIIGQLA